jgi:hypothetical protein
LSPVLDRLVVAGLLLDVILLRPARVATLARWGSG